MKLSFSVIFVFCLCYAICWKAAGCNLVFSSDIKETVSKPSFSIFKDIDIDWGGHFKVRGKASCPSSDSLFAAVDDKTWLDSNLEARFITDCYFKNSTRLEVHYEVILSVGDTIQNIQKMKSLFPKMLPEEIFSSNIPRDDRRLLDLTSVVSKKEDYIFYHRLDRLALSLTRNWGTVCVGRQTVTWGHGMLFNPMDLFNPFSPTDIERDYKMGDDMLSAHFNLSNLSDFQFLYVPRRNPLNHDIAWDHSSLAGKYHFFHGMTEFEIMMARHYESYVAGLGSVGYLGNAAWRMDATWTQGDSGDSQKDYFSLVVNMDYSWVWWQKNVYGFLEFFYSGIGKSNYSDAIIDSNILERLNRGELFTLGKTYLGCHLRMELHPLFNVLFTSITNLQDPSGVFQPRAVYDMTENMQVLLGATIPWGAKGTEFGGFQIPKTTFTSRSAVEGFLWMSYYF
jgi:hypothetical protein